VNASVGPGAFAVAFAPNGTALVSETGPAAEQLAISSMRSATGLWRYQQQHTHAGRRQLLDAIILMAVCLRLQRGILSISGLRSAKRSADADSGYGARINPGSTNIDIAASADGEFLYSLNAGSGSVGSRDQPATAR